MAGVRAPPEPVSKRRDRFISPILDGDRSGYPLVAGTGRFGLPRPGAEVAGSRDDASHLTTVASSCPPPSEDVADRLEDVRRRQTKNVRNDRQPGVQGRE